MGRSDLQKKWDKRREMLNLAKQTGQVMILSSGKRIQVAAPINEEFAKGAKELAGNWRPRTGVWSFRAESKRLVIELAKRIFGEDSIR